MKTNTPWTALSLLLISIFILQSCKTNLPANWEWQTISTNGQPVARHEAGLVAHNAKLYLIGGRRINPTSVYDPQTNTWADKTTPPLEIHHFQPVAYENAIYIVGALTGQWPHEKPLDRVIIYYPERDEYVYSHPIPEHRRRGGAGVVVYDRKIYLVGGIVNGHMNGYQSWFDEYDPLTGNWKVLPDAPHARDHFQAVVVDDKLFAYAGRTSSRITEEDMTLTVSYGNSYDFRTQTWEPVTKDTAIPTLRAGTNAFAWNKTIVIGGGESIAQVPAHQEVEAYNPATKLWSNWPLLNQGRHGTGFAIIDNYVYTAAGCGKRGGEPELTTLERLELPKGIPAPKTTQIDTTPIYKQWHTLTLPFKGPETSELDENNPFLNYRLTVEFQHAKSSQVIRGFYAADGDAATTSAKSGNVWQARFTPDKTGQWSYKATLRVGKKIALSSDPLAGVVVDITNAEGDFLVIPSDKEGEDFRSKGRLEVDRGYFKFRGTEDYWLKVGANSPENLLAYLDFDDTYRIKAKAREEGEAVPPQEVHRFAPHLKDWKTGDPTWKNGKGKALIGAMNYLSEKRMNAVYFLTLNIMGDGKDVWPYISPDDFSRFDVSKLAQWEVLFQHAQSKGILLHVVLQETENETMLDNGETGPQRQLYFLEMMARYGHHLGLIWNLGEENGPAPWSPVGQNDAQRKAMAKFIKKNDSYNHPVLLHTHSEDPLRSDVLEDIVGFKYVDGLSLQQGKREETYEVVEKWRKQAKSSGQEWLITMDEIGMWHTGALPDSLDPEHITLRRYALWGSLMAGGAGVEWYFGAKYPSNDLTSEDWRKRDRLWDFTRHAKVFFENYLPYWEMEPARELINSADAYCLKKTNEIYAVYLPSLGTPTIDLSAEVDTFEVHWYDSSTGGALRNGSVKTITGGGIRALGLPDAEKEDLKREGWVVLIRRVS